MLDKARTANLNNHESVRLPDMALLAMLQHHGAATPLLDVSLDPLVALYMATVSPDNNDDEKDGVFFALKKPADHPSDPLSFDTRHFRDIYHGMLNKETSFYSAPDVSDRLRIQRGNFLMGKVDSTSQSVTVPLSIEDCNINDTWLSHRMYNRGKSGRSPYSVASTDIATFRVTAAFKSDIREWLESRTGLTKDFVYPNAWHRPHLDSFAESHGRGAPL